MPKNQQILTEIPNMPTTKAWSTQNKHKDIRIMCYSTLGSPCGIGLIETGPASGQDGG